MPNVIETLLDKAIRRRTFQIREATAFVLSSYADAEATGESAVFERALRRATDPAIARMIKKHAEDEIRHARMLRERREALGLPDVVIPNELKLVDRLSEALGGVLERPMDTDEDVADVYALLYVIEERAIEAFQRSVEALESVGDKDTAEVFASIERDEHTHLRYCLAVGRRYAGSEARFAEKVEHVRTVEARVYGVVQRGFLMWMLRHRALALPNVIAMALGALMGATEVLGRPANRMHGPLGLAA